MMVYSIMSDVDFGHLKMFRRKNGIHHIKIGFISPLMEIQDIMTAFGMKAGKGILS